MLSGRERLRDWMERSKLNQRETAELFGISEVYISQILNEVRTPGLDNAIKIEELTGIPARSWAQSGLSSAADAVPVAASKRKIAKR